MVKDAIGVASRGLAISGEGRLCTPPPDGVGEPPSGDVAEAPAFRAQGKAMLTCSNTQNKIKPSKQLSKATKKVQHVFRKVVLSLIFGPGILCRGNVFSCDS